MTSATIDEEIRQINDQLDYHRQVIEQNQKRLGRLSRANKQFSEEPPVGTVLKFHRTLAGSEKVYTFVTVRTDAGWSVTGKRNTLRLIGLIEGPNSWRDLVIAAGEEVLWTPVGWDFATDDNGKDQAVDS